MRPSVVVHCEPSVTPDPSHLALRDPTAFLDEEAALVRWSGDDLDVDGRSGADAFAAIDNYEIIFYSGEVNLIANKSKSDLDKIRLYEPRNPWK